MSAPSRLNHQATPWRVAAVAIAALALLLMQTRHAEAAIGVTLTLNDNVAGAQTDLTLDITLDNDLANGETITVTLPAGWTVADGDLTGSVSWSGLMDVAPTITGNSAARTITTTTAAGQLAALPGLQIAISPSASIVNPAAPAAGLTITVDADGGNAQGTSAPFNIVAPAASAALTGTIQGGANTEGHIVAGGGTIILTLTNDTWVAAGVTFDGQRQNIINGIDSAGAEAAGWDAVVKAGLAVGDVVRTSNTVVTITLPAFAGYDITANETITVTIPGSALTGGSPVVAAPTFTILAASAAVTGTIQGGANGEADIVAGGGTIIITLTNDTWVAAGATFDGQRQNIINGIDSAGAEGAGWDAVVKAGLAVGDVVRTSATVVTVTLPAFAGYNITANETITVTVPASAIASAGALVATPTFTITAAAGPTAVTAVSFAGSSTLQNAASTYTVTFTASGSGALVAGGTVTVVMTGFSLTNGATAVTLGGAFVGTAAGNVAGGNTLTVTLNGGASLANSATGTIAFATTNPGAGTIAAAGLTVATSSDTTAVQSGNSITITAPAPVVEPPLLCAAGTFSGNGFAPCQPCPAGQTSTQGATQCTVTPKLTALALIPLTAAGTWDVNVPLSDWPRATLTDGQTAYTLTVASGRSYGVAAEANRGTLTYRHLSTGVAFDPNSTVLTLPATVVITITVPDGPAVSYTLSVRAPQPRLAFERQPSGAVADQAFTIQPRVEVRDGTTRITSSSATVTLSLKAGTGTAGAVLTSSATSAAAGLVTFSGVKIDRAGTGYVLMASSGSMTVESEPFDVAAGRPVLATLALVPAQSGYERIEVPVVPGQTAYEVPVPAYNSTTRGPRYNLSATMSGTTEIQVRALGANWAPTGIAFQSGETITFTGTSSAGTSPTYTVRLVAQTAVTNVTISASPTTPNASTTITATFRATTALVASDTITVRMDGYTYPVGTVRVTAGTGITGTLTGTVSSAARDTIVITGGAVAAGTQATLTFPATNPAASTIAKAGLTVHTSKDPTPVASRADIVIRHAITDAAVTLSSPTPNATSVVATITFTTPVPIPVGGRIMVGLPGFSWPATPSASFTAPAGAAASASASFAGNMLTLTTSTGAIPAGTVTLRVTGATNPAAQAARTDVFMRVTNAAGETLAETSSGTLVAIGAPRLTNAAVTLSPAVANAANVEATITFTTPVAIPVGGTIKVTLPGFAWPAAPNATFVSGTATATSAFAGNVLTVTTSTAAIAANSTVTLRVTGATLPAAQAAKTDVRMSVSSAAGAVLAETQTGTLVAIKAPSPRLEFANQPQDSNTGVANINITVRVLKADGTVDTGFTGKVGLAVDGPGVLRGFGSVTATNGVATFERTWSAPSVGPWVLQASARGYEGVESDSFRVTAPVTRLVIAASSSATSGVAFAEQPVVRVVNASGATVTTAAPTITLSSDRTLTCTGTTSVTAVAGVATFAGCRLTGTAGTASITASATGFTSVSQDVTLRVPVTATKLVFTGTVPSTLRAGEKFTLQVQAQDATGAVAVDAIDTVTLAGTSQVLRGSLTAKLVGGVATFSGIYWESTGANRTTRVTASASGLTAATTGDITVTPDNMPSALVVIAGPTYEVSGVNFSTQPQVKLVNAAGTTVTGAEGSVAVSIGTPTISLATATLTQVPSPSTPLMATFVGQAATFVGLRATGDTDTQYVLRFTYTGSGPQAGITLTAESSPFRLYATATAATTAKTSEQSVNLKFNYDSSLLSDTKSTLASGLQNDVCAALGREASSCARVTVTLSKAVIDTARGIMGLSTDSDPLVTIGAVDMDAFIAAHSAPPAGTDLLQGLAVLARGDDGLPLEALPPGMRAVLTFTVPAGRILADTPVDDLQVVEWTGTGWREIAATVTANADGSFTLGAESAELTVFGVLYAPGASALSNFAGFGPNGGIALALFSGGRIETLEAAALRRHASGVWARRNDGSFRVLFFDGPAFLRQRFMEAFGGELPEGTVVILVQLPGR
ncbi:MAG: transcriptional regulator FtrA [Chloroflexota bacterium]